MATKLFKIGNDLSMKNVTLSLFYCSAKPKALTNSAPKLAGCLASHSKKVFRLLPHN